MSVYKAADGWDNEAGYVTLDPQPGSPDGVKFPEIFYGGLGEAQPKGKRFLVLVWNSIDTTGKANIRSQLGLSDTVLTNRMTMYLPDNDGNFANWNVIVNSEQDFTRGSSAQFPSYTVTVFLYGAT